MLMKPVPAYEKEVREFRREFMDTKSSMPGTGPLEHMDNTKEWLEYSRNCENRKTCPENLVTYEQFIYVRETDKKIVGMIVLRHYLNEFLEKYGGHIGYSVRPSERKKGYGKRMLAECLKVCKTRGLKDVLITCTQENEGSRRIILANGGVYDGTVYCEPFDLYIERYWIHLN